MARNPKNISSKSQAHLVRQISPTEFQVLSASSGNVYNVQAHEGGYRCNCKFGDPFQNGRGRKSSGCSHVVAVIRAEEEEKGHQILVFNERKSLDMLQLPVMEVGQGLYVLSFAA